MSRKQRAEDVMVAFTQGMQYEEDWNESNVAAALREAVGGQLFVKDAILRLADELTKMVEE